MIVKSATILGVYIFRNDDHPSIITETQDVLHS